MDEGDELEQLKKQNEHFQNEICRLKSLIENQTSRGEIQKQGMINKATQGDLMARPPFGYKLEAGKLVPAENFREIEEIFEEFLRENISLRKLSERHSLSVNGLKKVLSNFTYIGKIKFNNQIHEGKHKPLISTTLFNHVQNKLDRLRKKSSE